MSFHSKGIFKDIFLLILLYFWNCHFILKTNINVSIENQVLFASIIFLLKINTKFSIWISCTFSTCDFVLKTNTIFSIENQLIFLSIIFLLKINWFLPASFFYWKSTRIFLLKSNWFLMILYFWHFLDVISHKSRLIIDNFFEF